MNILLVTHRYPVFHRPDLLSDVDALHHFAKTWVQQGHQVTVLHIYHHSNRKNLFRPPRFYRHIDSETTQDGVRICLVECRFAHRLKALTRKYFRQLAVECSQKIAEPDLLLVHFPTVLKDFAEYLDYRCPRIGVLHHTDLTKLGTPAVRSWLPTLYERYDALGFRSQKLRRDFEALGDCPLPEFMVYSGAPVNERLATREKTDGPLKLSYVGKLIARKQADMLIRALGRLKGQVDARLTIVGEGPERAKLEALIAAQGLSDCVTLTGALPREEVLRLMSEQDMFTMVSYGETLGLVYLEAMGQGLLTLGTRGEGIDGIIVDGENGFLLDRDDEAGLEALIRRVASMPAAERQRIAERGYQTACAMTEDAMAREYLEQAMALTK